MLIFAVRLIVEQNGLLLFLHQTKKKGGRFSLIGGNVEAHEFAREALAREALEEAGIYIRPEDLQLVHVLHRHKLKKGQTSLVLYFQTKQFQGAPASQEPKKFKDIAWFPRNLLPAEISKTTQHVLEAIRRGEVYSEYPDRNKILAHLEMTAARRDDFALP
ncbi:MAG: NUDIX domain-containing protein [Saprospiraceae bacterium]|nr:NUDIX domain-containing protein [Saprospiraceae bacterium]MDW8482854.1 NUDIX domain-containing protein [Saprospiraceae bacterium]